jgi:hypothetical protein
MSNQNQIILTQKELAKELSYTPEALSRAIMNNSIQLPPTRKVGTANVYVFTSQEELEKLKKEKSNPGKGKPIKMK